MHHTLTTKRVFMGRLPHGADFLDAIRSVGSDENIEVGWIQVVGAVQSVVLAYYDQASKTYGTCFESREGMEIVSAVGNISLKDGDPIAHMHMTVSDHQGKCFGGHVMPGTTIFAAEFVLREFEGVVLERGFDDVTGLPLWK